MNNGVIVEELEEIFVQLESDNKENRVFVLFHEMFEWFWRDRLIGILKAAVQILRALDLKFLFFNSWALIH